ncbi:MAG: RNA polymerase sigma factor, partial [Sarcina sp.]
MNEFKEFYEIYSKNIYRYLLFLTKSEMDAEDLMQETFIVAIKNINKFKGESS